MKTGRTIQGILLLAVLAAIGTALVYLPPKIVQQYDTVKSNFGETGIYIYFGLVGTGAAILLGCMVYTLGKLWMRSRRKRQRRIERDKNPSELTAQQQSQELDDNLNSISDLHSAEETSPELREQLQPLAEQLKEKRETQTLEIVAFGTISSGKSSLLNALAGQDIFSSDAGGGTTIRRNQVPWPTSDKVLLVDTPGLGEVDGAEHVVLSAESAQDADVVLLVVDGPLRDSEFRLLERLGEMEKRVVVCLNKSDWFDDVDQKKLLGQIEGQVTGIVTREDIVSVRSQPAKRSRMRILSDGTEKEELIEVPPDITALAKRMTKLVKRDGASLLLANLLLQSRGLVEDAKQKVADDLDRRAWKIVDKYMWGAGGAAALSPFPLVDLAAGCAISTKMVVDLAAVYRQEMDMEAAVSLLGELGKNLLANLGVSAATPLVAAGVASLLKTVPGIGTISGQLLQGIVQAIVTRWIGSVFIKYFKAEMNHPEGGLAALARKEWQHVTSLNELRKLVAEAKQRLLSTNGEEN